MVLRGASITYDDERVAGKHDIVSARTESPEAQRGEDAVRAMRANKNALDSQDLLNSCRAGAGLNADPPLSRPGKMATCQPS